MGSHKWLRAVCASTLATVGVVGASVPAAAQDDGAQPHVTYVACDAPAGGDGTQAHPFRDIKDLTAKRYSVLVNRCSLLWMFLRGKHRCRRLGSEGSPTVVGAYGTGGAPDSRRARLPGNQRAVIEVRT